MRTLIAGGGTGGHLTPALAVAQELRRADPSGAVCFVTRRGGVGRELLDGADIPVEELDVRGMDTSAPRTVVAALARIPAAVLQARRMIRRQRSDVVVGAAGYVCVPVVVAAVMERVPVVLLEQNALPGRAVRRLSRWSRAVCASFERTRTELPRARVVVTGNPVRPTVREGAPAPLHEACTHLLVTGGSQGARRLNRAIGGCVRALLEAHPGLQVTLQCGDTDALGALAARDELPTAVRDRYTVQRFFDDLPAAMRAADLVVMRAGGSSLAEATVLGRPMVLVPYPHAGGHQRANAAPYVRAGAAVLIEDAECTPARLQRELEALLADPARWRTMAAASAAAAHPEAAARVVAVLEQVVQGRIRDLGAEAR